MFGSTCVVEAEVAQVAAAGTAAPHDTRARRGLNLLEQQRAPRAAGARRGARRVHVALAKLVFEPLRGLLEAGRLFREQEVRVAARRDGDRVRRRDSARVHVRGHVCVDGVDVRVSVCGGGGEGRTWLRAAAAGTRWRSGCARASSRARQGRLAPYTLRRNLLGQIHVSDELSIKIQLF